MRGHALQDSHGDAVDCRPFISFMLDAIGNSLYKYIDVAAETVEDVGVNVGANVGVNGQILALLKREPALSAKELATQLQKRLVSSNGISRSCANKGACNASAPIKPATGTYREATMSNPVEMILAPKQQA